MTTIFLGQRFDLQKVTAKLNKRTIQILILIITLFAQLLLGLFEDPSIWLIIYGITITALVIWDRIAKRIIKNRNNREHAVWLKTGATQRSINFCLAIVLWLSARRYKFGHINNNELLVINLSAVRTDDFQIPVLRLAPSVDVCTYSLKRSLIIYENLPAHNPRAFRYNFFWTNPM